nr:hypothetical protein [Bacillus safensis]
MNNNRKSKIKTLKRKSRRKHLINELSYMTLPEHPFLDIEENQLFCQKVFAFLQSREHKIQIHGEHYREHEIEALKVNVNEVFIHLNRLLEQTKFSSGYGDFIFSRIFPFWIMHRENGIFL